jgi:hypothetical protein
MFNASSDIKPCRVYFGVVDDNNHIALTSVRIQVSHEFIDIGIVDYHNNANSTVHVLPGLSSSAEAAADGQFQRMKGGTRTLNIISQRIMGSVSAAIDLASQQFLGGWEACPKLLRDGLPERVSRVASVAFK